MKLGKPSEVTLKRSILKGIAHKNTDIITTPFVGMDAAAFKVPADSYCISAVTTTIHRMKNMASEAVYSSLNNVATSGATPFAIEVTLNIPQDAREIRIKEIMDEITTVCEVENVDVIGGNTEVTDAVLFPIINISAFGSVKKEDYISKNDIRPGNDIVMTKWTGLMGTSLIARSNEEELATRYPISLVRQAQSFEKYKSVIPEAKIASKLDITAMHDVSRRGIYEALWELVREANCGLRVDLKKIPIKQETVEVCEFYNINPYVLYGMGSLLITCENGEGLVNDLQEAGINAMIIGKIIEGNDKIIVLDDKEGYLESQKEDEIYKIK